VSSQSTSFVSTTYVNLSKHPELNLFWELTDAATVYDESGQPLASVISGEAPPVASGALGGPGDRGDEEEATGAEGQARPSRQGVSPP
jgi:hypothetical protein